MNVAEHIRRAPHLHHSWLQHEYLLHVIRNPDYASCQTHPVKLNKFKNSPLNNVSTTSKGSAIYPTIWAKLQEYKAAFPRYVTKIHNIYIPVK